MCGITANGKRLAFEEEVVTTGVPNNQELWMVMDLYGQTTELEIFGKFKPVLAHAKLGQFWVDSHVNKTIPDVEFVLMT